LVSRIERQSTPATAAASRAGVRFRVLTYPHDAEAADIGRHAAEALGLDPRRVFKTLVVAGAHGRLIVAVVPVTGQLDLKALATRAGIGGLAMAAPTRAERASGYAVGGISPLGQRRAMPVYIDASALSFETIFVSAGRRGLELEIDPRDLLALCGGTAAEIAT
jgi:Cys-tRNA(Pro)/Cys-tRNA(Cys) deacylase